MKIIDKGKLKDNTKFVQLVDLYKHYSNQDGTLTAGEREVDRGDECYVNLPMDMPAYMRVMRLMRIGEGHKPEKNHYVYEHVGWTAEVDAYGFGVRIVVRVGRDGTLKVFAMDADGTHKLQEWTK